MSKGLWVFFVFFFKDYVFAINMTFKFYQLDYITDPYIRLIILIFFLFLMRYKGIIDM